MKFMHRLLAALLLTCLVSVPAMAVEPSDAHRAGDAVRDILVARPLGVVITGIGAALFVVSLPFSALGGNVGEAGKVLVVGPARETFARCLGCSSSDRSSSGYRD